MELIIWIAAVILGSLVGALVGMLMLKRKVNKEIDGAIQEIRDAADRVRKLNDMLKRD